MLADTAPTEKPVGQNPFVPSEAFAIGVTIDGQGVAAESSCITSSPLLSFSNVCVTG
jgi:hypothetical protein